ncbi:MAG: thiolase family protein [Bdellovibrionales bacterium]|jgi:acetyl-CoA C-acetyltransferase|nr:thiolase family protein [Bdellovibrionales bacterium]
MSLETVYIASAARTPVGSFQGSLSELPAPRLGAIAIKEAVARAGIKAESIDEVIMGEVLTAGVGQAPARQAVIYAGLPTSVPALTINKVCGSGLKAVMLATDNIRLGHTQIAVAGGQENMTLAPHLLAKSRTGFRMGNTNLIDSMINDGLWDPYNDFHMGVAAELCVKENAFTREQQDEFAIGSYKKAQHAQAEGLFKKEIVGVEIASRKGTIIVDTDEEPTKTDFSKIPGLKPAFDKTGTVTAANASKINDGAAALVLMGETALKANGVKPLAKVLSHATFAQDPKWFTTAPVGAMKKAVQAAGLDMSQIDLFEINEAFSAVTMVAMKDLKLAAEKVNVHGGAVAIGHPIGASGARILTTLVHALHQHGKRYGLATLCIGGGEAVAVVIEKA